MLVELERQLEVTSACTDPPQQQSRAAWTSICLLRSHRKLLLWRSHGYALTAPCKGFPGSIQHVWLGTGQPPAHSLVPPVGLCRALSSPPAASASIGVAALCGDVQGRDRAEASCHSNVTSASVDRSLQRLEPCELKNYVHTHSWTDWDSWEHGFGRSGVWVFRKKWVCM